MSDEQVKEATEAGAGNDNENKSTAKSARSSNYKFKMAFLIMLAAAIVLVVIATVIKIKLTSEALENQAKYEQICVLFKGELAISKTEDGQVLDCVSSMFTTPDGLRLCNSEEECEGTCIGDFTANVDYQGSCSEGILLLPRFLMLRE